MTKHIFVTGGVVSSLGKGITAASLGRLLKSRGYKVMMQKADPYLNVDPGTMSPFQHGEVFVTEDGKETDLDLGHYERFIDENLTRSSNFTTGAIYQSLINRERAGDFLDAELPDKEVILNVDRGLFRRLLDNLTGNFLKYTPSGSTLYVKLVTSPRCVTVTVADDGPGIPERISRQIFSPFVTGDSARASGSGSGLGLTIAKKIVELHGGTIKLITPPHSPFKTEFEISLPVSAQNTQA